MAEEKTNYFMGAIETLTYTVKAADTVKAGQLIGYDDKPALSGALVQGAAAHDAETGDNLRITAIGLLDMAAGGKIKKGDKLAAGADARAVAAASGGASFGVAVSDALENELVSVLMK